VIPACAAWVFLETIGLWRRLGATPPAPLPEVPQAVAA